MIRYEVLIDSPAPDEELERVRPVVNLLRAPQEIKATIVRALCRWGLTWPAFGPGRCGGTPASLHARAPLAHCEGWGEVRSRRNRRWAGELRGKGGQA